MISSINAKEQILSLLGDNVTNERVIEELEDLSDSNFVEILLQKKIVDFLKEKNEYFLVTGEPLSLYIYNLLGISTFNPMDEKSYLPYYMDYKGYYGSMHSVIRISNSMKPIVFEYLKLITNNQVAMAIDFQKDCSCKVLDDFFIVPLEENLDLTCDYRDLDYSKVAAITVYSSKDFDDINYFIRKYGYPVIDIKNDKRIDEAFFKEMNIIGLSYCEYNKMKSILMRCDESIWNYQTYVYVYALTMDLYVNKRNVKYFFDILNKDTMNDYPSMNGSLYRRCLELGLSKEEALSIYGFSQECKYHEHGIRKNKVPDAYDKLPINIKKIIDGLDFIWFETSSIFFAEFNYLEMYYKLYADDYYEIKLGDSIEKFDSMTDLEFEELVNNIDKKHPGKNEEYDAICLYIEYKNKTASKNIS